MLRRNRYNDDQWIGHRSRTNIRNSSLHNARPMRFNDYQHRRNKHRFGMNPIWKYEYQTLAKPIRDQLVGRIYSTGQYYRSGHVTERELHSLFGMYAWHIVYPKTKIVQDRFASTYILLDPRDNRIIDVL